ncbi:MAG: AtpZ/AtpI family protein [Nitrospirae bacterium]|nr:AtpZ/AtpI family protein [Nitrospirota bacterium]
MRPDCSRRQGGLVTEQKPEKSFIGHLLDASSVGIQLVVSTIVGFLIGYGMDSLFHTSPWLTFIFLIIGIIAGFRELLKIARKSDKWDDD